MVTLGDLSVIVTLLVDNNRNSKKECFKMLNGFI